MAWPRFEIILKSFSSIAVVIVFASFVSGCFVGTVEKQYIYNQKGGVSVTAQEEKTLYGDTERYVILKYYNKAGDVTKQIRVNESDPEYAFWYDVAASDEGMFGCGQDVPCTPVRLEEAPLGTRPES